MNDKIEIQGKTVEEAVNEALLRLGARRDEVDVTVLDEPKSGFLGFLGGKPARVEVSRKRSRRRGQRQGGGDQAHEFGDGPGEGSRGRGSRGRRSRNDRRDRNDRDDRDGRRDRNEQEASGGRGGRNQRKDRQEEGSRDKRQADGRSRDERDGGNEGRQDGEGSSRSRSRRRRRSRKPRTEGAEAQSQNQSQDSSQEKQGRGRRERPAAAKVADDQPTESVKDPRRTRGRNQRGRRRGEGGRVDPDPRPAETMEAVEADGNTIQPETQPQPDRQESRGRDGRGRGGRRRENSRRGDEPRSEPRGEARAEARDENPRNDVIDETIATGIPVTKYAEATRGVGEDEINATIEKLTGGVLVRAGFPARCEVKDGEYRQVRITTGDDGAAVLIGRHGNTIDSLEHLVERMISTAHGDRVRMNLDVNNYRRRRSDSLTDRVDEAVEQVRSSGKAYHVEPMNARERRLVHLAVEQYEGMRTFTMDSHRGRHVVIALDNQEGDADDVGTETVDSVVDTPEAVEVAAAPVEEAVMEVPEAEEEAVVEPAVVEEAATEEETAEPEDEDRK